MSGRRQVIIAFAVLTAVFAGLLYRAEHETEKVNERVSRVESPCLKYGPKSKVCQRSFERALLTLTHPESCAVERKAGTLKAIRELAATLGVTVREPCKGARLAQERTRHKERTATAGGDQASAPLHTDAPSTTAPGSHGHSGPPSSGSHHPSAPANPGTTQPSEPPSSGPAPENSAPPSPVAEDEPAAEAPPTRHPGLIESAGTGAKVVTEDLCSTAEKLLGACP